MSPSRPEPPRRTLLLVSPMQLDALAAGLASGADIVVVDLEDGYLAGRCGEARANLARMLSVRPGNAGQQVFARINSARSVEGLRDLAAIIDGRLPLDGLMCPKIGGPAELAMMDDLMRDAGRDDIELGAIIETAEGLENACAIALATPRLQWLAFGGYDLSAALGTAMAWPSLGYARARTSHAAALAGIVAFDCPTAGEDAAKLRQELQAAADFGFTGKACKSAGHVAEANRQFTPGAAELARAHAIIAAADAAGGRVPVFDGRMIEPPTVRALRRVIARGEAAARARQ